MRKPTMDYNASTHVPSMANSHASLQGYSDSHADQPYYSQSDREGRSSRASSRTQSDMNSEASRYNRARKPINEAVTSALNTADANHVAIPPDVLTQITTQITANVLQQLKANNIPAPITVPESTSVPTTASQRPTMSKDRTESSSSFTGSPPLDRSKVYTPPSPHRSFEQTAQSQTSPTFSNFSMGSTHVPDHSTSKRPISPFSGAGHSDDSDEKEKLARPDAPRRVSTSGSATILEKVWGKMYDDEGRCTERLGQYLRGIAVHIIEDYEPKNSLVITPDKMQKYYEETKLSNEYYPWQDVFDDRTSRISRMFRDMEVQHHLVQDRLSERPDIPGMTPQGFETWMKLALRAQPDLEFERLAKTALHMPISNPDDKQERFPKQISRRLFPKDHDPTVVRKLEKVMRTHCGVRLPTRGDSSTESDSKTAQSSGRDNASSQPTVNASQRVAFSDDNTNATSTQSHRPSVSERQAPPPPRAESVVDEDDLETVNSKPIERERKPYVAQPGGGKTYNDTEPSTLSRVSTIAGDTFSTAPPPVKISRSASVTGTTRANDTKPRVVPVALHQRNVQPVGVPESRHHRTRSFATNEPRTNRNRSPSETRNRDQMHRSENDIKSSSYQSAGSTDYSSSTYRPDKYTQDRYNNEHRASIITDQRERDRERDRGRDDRDRERDRAKPRYQSISQAEPTRHYYPPPEEEYYRNSVPNASSNGSGWVDGVYYPPNSYRTKN